MHRCAWRLTVQDSRFLARAAGDVVRAAGAEKAILAGETGVQMTVPPQTYA